LPYLDGHESVFNRLQSNAEFDIEVRDEQHEREAREEEAEAREKTAETTARHHAKVNGQLGRLGTREYYEI